MNDLQIQEIIENMNLPEFREALKNFKTEILENADADSEDREDVQDLGNAIDEVLQVLANTPESNLEKDEKLFSAIKNYFTCLEVWEESEGFGLRELEDLDIEDFRLELNNFKKFLTDTYAEADDLSEEEKEGKEEQFALIERMQETFSTVQSLDDFSEEELEEIRSDFEHYEEFSSRILTFLNEDEEEGEEFDGEEEEDEYYRQLEDIEVSDFKAELNEFKGVLDELASKGQVEKEALGLVTRLQKAFAKADSLDDLSEQQLEAIRPDFDAYEEFMNGMLDALAEDEDDEEFDLEETEFDEDESKV